MNKPDPATAIGAMAEMMGFFYRQLIQQGFDATQAMDLTKHFMITTLSNPKEENDNG